MRHAPSSAFTLVEMSVVLVLIGLLVGGIMLGKSMVHNSELRSVITQEQRFVSAVQNFRDKYQAIPGDMVDATSIWGTDPNCPGDYTTPSTGAATCNGDGNGLVYFTGSGTNPTTNEVYRFWQQLANAGFIEGTYPGVPGVLYFWNTTTTNAPTSKIATASWSVLGRDNSAGGLSISIPSVNLGNMFLLGGRVSGSWNSGSVLTSPETYSIDIKMDDGNPVTGKVLARVSTACSGVNDPAAIGAYVLNSSALACFIIFDNAF